MPNWVPHHLLSYFQSIKLIKLKCVLWTLIPEILMILFWRFFNAFKCRFSKRTGKISPRVIPKGASGGCSFQIHFIFPYKRPFLIPKGSSDGCPFQIRSGCGCQLDFRTQNGRPSDILCYLGLAKFQHGWLLRSSHILADNAERMADVGGKEWFVRVANFIGQWINQIE